MCVGGQSKTTPLHSHIKPKIKKNKHLFAPHSIILPWNLHTTHLFQCNPFLAGDPCYTAIVRKKFFREASTISWKIQSAINRRKDQFDRVKNNRIWILFFEVSFVALVVGEWKNVSNKLKKFKKLWMKYWIEMKW